MRSPTWLWLGLRHVSLPKPKTLFVPVCAYITLMIKSPSAICPVSTYAGKPPEQVGAKV